MNWTRWSDSAGVSRFSTVRSRAGRTDAVREKKEDKTSAKAHNADPPNTGMGSAGAHRITRPHYRNRRGNITHKPDMKTGRQRGHLHLPRTLVLLVALTMQPQVSHRLSAISGGMLLNPRSWLLTVVESVFLITIARKLQIMESMLGVPIPFVLPSFCAHLLFQPTAADYTPQQNYCNPVYKHGMQESKQNLRLNRNI